MNRTIESEVIAQTIRYKVQQEELIRHIQQLSKQFYFNIKFFTEDKIPTVRIDFFFDALQDEFICGWRFDTSFYNKKLKSFFKNNRKEIKQ